MKGTILELDLLAKTGTIKHKSNTYEICMNHLENDDLKLLHQNKVVNFGLQKNKAIIDTFTLRNNISQQIMYFVRLSLISGCIVGYFASSINNITLLCYILGGAIVYYKLYNFVEKKLNRKLNINAKVISFVVFMIFILNSLISSNNNKDNKTVNVPNNINDYNLSLNKLINLELHECKKILNFYDEEKSDKYNYIVYSFKDSFNNKVEIRYNTITNKQIAITYYYPNDMKSEIYKQFNIEWDVVNEITGIYRKNNWIAHNDELTIHGTQVNTGFILYNLNNNESFKFPRK